MWEATLNLGWSVDVEGDKFRGLLTVQWREYGVAVFRWHYFHSTGLVEVKHSFVILLFSVHNAWRCTFILSQFYEKST